MWPSVYLLTFAIKEKVKTELDNSQQTEKKKTDIFNSR